MAGCPFLNAAAYRQGRADTDGPSKCTWYPGMSEAERALDPHRHTPLAASRPKILPSVLAAVGNTPCIRINNISASAGLECELVAKCEYFSAGGSVKDRIGLRMIEQAEASGRIKPGDTLIEATSGNTGIGLALAAALKGYRMIITLPEKMSQEKVDVLKALGAEIIRTPTEAAYDSPESHIGVARRLVKELPNAHILDQYRNADNPLVHYDTTAEEIWRDCEGKVDMLVCTAGTGGTLTGIGRRLKELNPALIIVGVDPRGSILAEPDALNDEHRLQSYAVEGIGYDFVPLVLDRALVAAGGWWEKTDDAASLVMARRLIREEGMLVGSSSGSAVVGALAAARRLKAGQRCVVVLSDSVRNYMSKHLRDSWMAAQGLPDTLPPSCVAGLGAASPRSAAAVAAAGGGGGGGGGSAAAAAAWWAHRSITELAMNSPVTAGPAVTVKEAVGLLNSLGIDQLPIVGEDNSILGVVTEGNLSARMLSGRTQGSDPVSSVLFKGFRKVTVGATLGQLAKVFDSEPYAVVLQTQKVFMGGPSSTEKSVVVGVVTRIDLLKFISEGGGGTPKPSTPARSGSGAQLAASERL